MNISSDLKKYKCAACGGLLKFSSQKQKLVCTYCKEEFDVRDYEFGSDAKSRSTANKIEWDYKTRMFSTYVCKNCGGEAFGDESMASTKCPFCNYPIVISERISGFLEPDIIIPFKKNKTIAMDMYREHIKKYKYASDEFKDENHINEIVGVYIPFWTYDADVHATLKSTHGTGDNKECESIYELDVSFKNVPADASKKFDNDLMDSIEPYDFEEAVPFSPAYMAGYLAQKFDVDEYLCHLRADEKIEQTTTKLMNNALIKYKIGENNILDWEKTSYSNKYALLPVWILNTTWQNENYIFAMNGQTGKMIGDLPADKKKLSRYFWMPIIIFWAVCITIMLLFHNIVVTTIGIWLLCFMTFDLIVFSWIKTMIKASSTKNVLKSENADDYVIKDSLKFGEKKSSLGET